jgi:hypothetical protein
VLDLMGGTLDLARSFDPNLTRELALDCELALDRVLTRALALTRAINLAFERVRTLERILTLARVLTAVLALAIARTHNLDAELKKALQELKQQLSDSAEDTKEFEQWWQAHGAAWTEQLRAATLAYRHLGHDWQLSQQQQQALKQYYYANHLLVDCLNNARYVTRTVRQELEDTLLLPISLL